MRSLIRAVVLLGFLASPQILRAEECPFLFEPYRQIGTNNTPADIALGDFNEDGIIDMAVATQDLPGTGTGSAVAIHIGLGARLFAPPVYYPLPRDPMRIVTGDFNEDGITDLAVSETFDQRISILIGQGSGTIGNGTFAAAVSYAAPARAFGIGTADFNQDGIADIVISSDNSSNAYVFPGLGSGGVGNGQFGSSTAFAHGGLATSLATADLNGDGHQDLVVIENFNSTLSVFLGTGTSTIGPSSFAAPVHYAVGADPFDVTVADFDEDGALDIAVGKGGNTGVQLLKGVGNGTFTSWTFLPAGSGNSVITLDANLDGILDLAFSNWPEGAVKVYLGLGSGGAGSGLFASPMVLSVGSNAYQMAAGDIDQDGRTDILVAMYQQNYVALLAGGCLADPRVPQLTDVRDVPNDNGGFVFLTWNGSSLDVTGGAVNSYRVWRRIPPALGAAALAAKAERDRIITREISLPDGTMLIEYWEALITLPAQRLPGYGYTATTTQDSMRHSNPYSAFFVTALTANIDVFYSSNVDSGYSVDNIKPRRPEAFHGVPSSGNVALSWDENPEPDLEEYRLYRSTDPGFIPSGSNLLAATSEPAYIDANGGVGYCYKLTAVDAHENESVFAVVDLTSVLDAGGTTVGALALHGARPNPSMNGALTLHFTLPGALKGRLDVVDLAGRSVASQSLDHLGPGNHAVTVGGSRRLAPGVYLVRLTYGASVREVKAVVTR